MIDLRGILNHMLTNKTAILLSAHICTAYYDWLNMINDKLKAKLSDVIGITYTSLKLYYSL